MNSKKNKLIVLVSIFFSMLIASCGPAQPVKHLHISNLPNIVSYNINDYLSLDGLEVVDDSNNVVNDYLTSMEDGEMLCFVGKQKILVSKEGYSGVVFDVNVKDSSLPPLNVSTNPIKLLYKVGDTFSLEGIKVTSGNAVITDFVSSIEEGTMLKEKGEHKVIISKEGYLPTSFIIFVQDNSSTRVNNSMYFYYVNDLHGAFNRDASNDEAGISYISSYLVNIKNTYPYTTILLSGGDMFQGGFESNYTYGQIMVDAMNLTGFDAMTLGNHEFDWGEAKLRYICESLDCPVLSCNTFYSINQVSAPEYIQPFTIIERGGLKVGIIGAIQEGINTSITGSVSKRFYFPNPVPFIKQYSDLLRNAYKCDMVVANFHASGFDSGEFDYPEILETSPNSGKKYVDGVFLAHDHYQKRGEECGTPYIESGCNGEYVGKMGFSLGYNQETKEYKIELYSTYNSYAYNTCTTSNNEVDALLVKYRSVISKKNEIIAVFFNSYSRRKFSEIICNAMYVYLNKHKDLFDNYTVYFASCNASGCRANVSKGPFTYGDLEKVYPFTNYPCIQRCTRDHISFMEEDSYYATYKAGSPVYVDNITRAVTVNYMAENDDIYTSRYQLDYEAYNFVQIKDMLVEYLKSGVVL